MLSGILFPFFCLLTEKKMHNIRTVGLVLFGDLTEDSDLGDSLSDTLRSCSEEVGEEPVYM